MNLIRLLSLAAVAGCEFMVKLFEERCWTWISTPLYQILNHALADKSNKTKFTLLFSNLSEKDILLREEFDSLAKKHPETLKVVYYVDKGEKDWKGM